MGANCPLPTDAIPAHRLRSLTPTLSRRKRVSVVACVLPSRLLPAYERLGSVSVWDGRHLKRLDTKNTPFALPSLNHDVSLRMTQRCAFLHHPTKVTESILEIKKNSAVNKKVDFLHLTHKISVKRFVNKR